MQPQSVTLMTSQVQTSLGPQTYTEQVAVTTTRQVVEEQGGYVTQAIPVTTVVPANGCAPTGGASMGDGRGGLGGLFSRCGGGPGCGHKCGHRCGGGCGLCGGVGAGGGGFAGGGYAAGGSAVGGYTTQTSCSYTQVYVSRPVVRSIPETTYVNQTKTRMVPVNRSFRCPRLRLRWFP